MSKILYTHHDLADAPECALLAKKNVAKGFVSRGFNHATFDHSFLASRVFRKCSNIGYLVIGWSKKSGRRGKDIDEDVDAYYDTMVGNWAVSAIGQRKDAAVRPHRENQVLEAASRALASFVD